MLLLRITEVLDADTAAILLMEEDGALHLRATIGLDEEVERAIAIPLGAGMAGRVAATRQPIVVPDLSQIELYSPVLRERGIGSLVAIPLLVEDRVIGVVHAGPKKLAHFVDGRPARHDPRPRVHRLGGDPPGARRRPGAARGGRDA